MLAFGRQKHLYYSLDTNSHHATNRLKQKTTLKRMLDCYDCKLKSTYKLQTLKNGVYTQLFIKRKTFFFFARQIKIKANEKNKTTKNELKDREKKVASSMICNTESFSSN